MSDFPSPGGAEGARAGAAAGSEILKSGFESTASGPALSQAAAFGAETENAFRSDPLGGIEHVAEVVPPPPPPPPASFSPDAPAAGFAQDGPTNGDLASASGIDIGQARPLEAPAPLDFDKMSDTDRIGAANSQNPDVRAQFKAWKDRNVIPRGPKPGDSGPASPAAATTSTGEPIQLSNDEINRRMLGKTDVDPSDPGFPIREAALKPPTNPDPLAPVAPDARPPEAPSIATPEVQAASAAFAKGEATPEQKAVVAKMLAEDIKAGKNVNLDIYDQDFRDQVTGFAGSGATIEAAATPSAVDPLAVSGAAAAPVDGAPIPDIRIDTGKTEEDIFDEYSRGDYTREQIESIQDPTLREQLLNRIDSAEKVPDPTATLAQEQLKKLDETADAKAVALGIDASPVRELVQASRQDTLDEELWQAATPQEREAAFAGFSPEQQAKFPLGELGGIEAKTAPKVEVPALETDELLATNPDEISIDQLEANVDALYDRLGKGELSDEQIDALSEFDDALQFRKDQQERSEFRVPTPDGMRDGETLAQFTERQAEETRVAALDAEFSTQQSRLDAMRSTDPELKKRYQEYNTREEDKRQRTRFEDPKYRPTDARQGESYDQYVDREAKIKQALGTDEEKGKLTQEDIDLIQPDMDRLDEIKGKLSSGTKIENLSPQERSLANKYGIEPESRRSSSEARADRIRYLEGEIQKNNPDPKIQEEYTKLRAEQGEEQANIQRRDELKDKLLKDGKLPDELKGELDRLNAELKDKQMTPEERTTELNRLTDKMLHDWVFGDGMKPEDAERFAKLKGEEAGDASSRREGARAIMEKMLSNKKEGQGRNLKDKRETAVEKQTKEKLANLMSLEMQLMGLPQQLEALATSQDQIREDIDAKKREIDGFKSDQEQARKRTELYPLMMGLARNKGLISHYSNHARVLKAEYKTTMADLNRLLKLNGRFGMGIIPDVLQHASAQFSRIMADIKTDYDSVYGSDSGNARRIARSTA